MKTTYQKHNWELLNDNLLKYREKIRAEWSAVLNNKELKEEDYHQFLRKYPYWLLIGNYDAYHVISKLKLGAEYVSDFVIAREGYSEGTYYDFIEIENPHDKVYTKKGIPSTGLVTAIQQVNDWRSWLKDNHGYFRKYLPTSNTRVYRNTNLTFTIIIGRRENNIVFQDRINEYARSVNVRIRSFDSLTENLNKPLFDEALFASSEYDHQDPILKNSLANPFFMATDDSEWREMISKSSYHSHFYGKNLENIIASRKYNDLLDEFLNDERHINDNWLTTASTL